MCGEKVSGGPRNSFTLMLLNEDCNKLSGGTHSGVTIEQVEMLTSEEQRAAKQRWVRRRRRIAQTGRDKYNPILLHQKSRVSYKGEIGIVKKPVRKSNLWIYLEIDGKEKRIDTAEYTVHGNLVDMRQKTSKN